jgi:putative addiction module component (TIGR02574 family)
MNFISVDDVLGLPFLKRIQIVEMISESVVAIPQVLEVSPELKSELNVYMVEFERDPESGYSWDQVKAKLKNGSWHTA